MLEAIITLLALAVILATLWSIGRRRRTYEQTWTIPTFTDSMPGHREYAEGLRIAQMVADAKYILAHQYAGKSASRRNMVKAGVSERRWRAAILLLRGLHVYDRRSYVPVVSERFAMQRLDRYQRKNAGRLHHSPAAYVSSN